MPYGSNDTGELDFPSDSMVELLEKEAKAQGRDAALDYMLADFNNWADYQDDNFEIPNPLSGEFAGDWTPQILEEEYDIPVKYLDEFCNLFEDVFHDSYMETVKSEWGEPNVD